MGRLATACMPTNRDGMNRVLLFLAALLWIALATPVWAADCTTSAITATGAGSCSVPASVTTMTFSTWGSGASGSGSSSSFHGGGGGGGFSSRSMSVTPGGTIFYSVGAGPSGGTGVSTVGNNSWINKTSNAQPSSSADGVYAEGGNANPDNGGSAIGGHGNLGTTENQGGSGVVTAGNGGGGGGGAGSGGAGGSGSGTTGGTAGTPDGGAGGNGGASGSNGSAVGGGGGGGKSGSGGNGARGQVQLTFSAPPPASGNFVFIPAVIP